MTTLTGLDLPVGSPGGSVELLWDLYLASNAPIPADVFMLAAPSGHTEPSPPAEPSRPADRGPERPVQLAVAGKQLDGAGFWAYVDRLTTAIRQRFSPGDYATIHLQHLAFGATPALLRAFAHHPSLALVHGTDLLFAADHPTQAEVLHEATASTDAVVVPTTAMADLLLARTSATPRRIVHIPWGVPDRLLATPHPHHRPEDGDLRLLYAGRLTAEKGVEHVIEAVSDLDGASLSVAAPAVDYLALGDRIDLSRVRYLGWLARAELWRTFSDHDVLVVGSTRLEAFGLVAVEAQACGLPVVYQAVPGLAEVLGDSALAVDLRSGPQALADTVAWLRKDPATLDDLRTAGYRNARRFPLSRTAREIEDLSLQL